MSEPTPTGWTDHNVADPGLTLVQTLVYAIGAVGLAITTVAFIRKRRNSRNADAS